MGALTGFTAVGNYAGAATDSAAVDILLNLLPDPDTDSSSGAIQGSFHFLDQMSPACNAQLRIELIALKGAVDTTNTL